LRRVAGPGVPVLLAIVVATLVGDASERLARQPDAFAFAFAYALAVGAALALLGAGAGRWGRCSPSPCCTSPTTPRSTRARPSYRAVLPLSGRYLSFAEREEIAILHAQGHGVREIAGRIGRSAATVSRELRRNAATRSGAMEYRATTAQWHADRRARRPKVAKLAANDALREYVQDRLAGVSMRISHEAIYQALYVQGRGALRRELVACLRTGRALRVPRARTPPRALPIDEKDVRSPTPRRWAAHGPRDHP